MIRKISSVEKYQCLLQWHAVLTAWAASCAATVLFKAFDGRSTDECWEETLLFQKKNIFTELKKKYFINIANSRRENQANALINVKFNVIVNGKLKIHCKIEISTNLLQKYWCGGPFSLFYAFHMNAIFPNLFPASLTGRKLRCVARRNVAPGRYFQ